MIDFTLSLRNEYARFGIHQNGIYCITIKNYCFSLDGNRIVLLHSLFSFEFKYSNSNANPNTYYSIKFNQLNVQMQLGPR